MYRRLGSAACSVLLSTVSDSGRDSAGSGIYYARRFGTGISSSTGKSADCSDRWSLYSQFRNSFI